jgi:OOP family OmpA-OmpF porin
MTTQIESRRRRTGATVAVGILLLGALAVATVVLRTPAIEEDIEARTMSWIAAQSFETGVTGAVSDGRDVTLVGQVPAEHADYFRERIGSLRGVRSVTFETAPLATPEPATGTSTTTTAVAATTTTAIAAPALTAPTTTTLPAPEPAKLELSRVGITAAVPSPTDARRVEMGASAAGVAVEVVVDPDLGDASWLDGIDTALASLRGVGTARLEITADAAVLSGRTATEEQASSVLAAFADLGLILDTSDFDVASPPSVGQAAELEAELNAAVTDASVLFDTGSTAISETGGVLLDEIAVLLLQAPGARVEVQGHTDDVGTAVDNLALSQRQAGAIVAYLVDAGVDPVQVTAVGYGDTEPIADNATEEGRAANRRIEFVVEGAD